MTLATAAPTELLSPAGDWESLRAAVAGGADAVYFGLSNFNARHRATNFTLAELPEVIEFLHARNVRGYVTCNTLIFSEELPEIAQFIQAISAAGADAVIVQDVGLVRLIRELAPDLPIHGSTQMTLTEPRGIEFVRRLGVDRVILARELSIPEIVKIQAATTVPLEVFVHGALCVAYSGQCLTSEALGGRSANRGQCAQACRLPYELIVDGERRELGDVAYLLSPQDLAAYDIVDKLVAAGVCSLKIEGRLKSAQYVAVTTQTYRGALDAAIQGQTFALSKQGQLDLQQSFSRGFTHGFLDGNDHQVLVQGRFPKSRGVRVGTVIGAGHYGVVFELDPSHDPSVVKPGDGIVFDEGHPDQDEQGGRIYNMRELNSTNEFRRLELSFAHGAVNGAAVMPGAIVWKTDDPEFRRRVERSYSDHHPVRREPVEFHVAGKVGEPLTLVAKLADGLGSTQTWPGPLELARKHPTTIDALREQLDRLGETPFTLGTVAAELPDAVLVPRSVLNDLRRTAVDDLLQQRKQQITGRRHLPDALDRLRQQVAAVAPVDRPEKPQLAVLARTLDQLAAVLAWQPASPLAAPPWVYCDFEDVRRYKDGVALARAPGRQIGLATLRVLKPGEEGLLRQIAHCDADIVLCRNLPAIEFFRQHAPQTKLIGDFALNVANELTADLMRAEGLMRLTPSYDLNWEQFTDLVKRFDPGLWETVVHQHIPMFHMEHCVFAHTLSSGKDSTDCGRPCDRHRIELRDRVGSEFPLLADTGCRNTVFNSVAQSAAEYLPRMLTLGLRHFRVELLRETPDEVAPLLERYARVLAGLDDGRSSWRGLQILNQLGVTRGTMQMA
ncbi:MAG: U32 family peptidase [Planctomycetaceae bacterium]|nr:U32 family peptidase [Planctomycetaceae bacterium]